MIIFRAPRYTPPISQSARALWLFCLFLKDELLFINLAQSDFSPLLLILLNRWVHSHAPEIVTRTHTPPDAVLGADFLSRIYFSRIAYSLLFVYLLFLCFVALFFLFQISVISDVWSAWLILAHFPACLYWLFLLTCTSTDNCHAILWLFKSLSDLVICILLLFLWFFLKGIYWTTVLASVSIGPIRLIIFVQFLSIILCKTYYWFSGQRIINWFCLL